MSAILAGVLVSLGMAPVAPASADTYPSYRYVHAGDKVRVVLDHNNVVAVQFGAATKNRMAVSYIDVRNNTGLLTEFAIRLQDGSGNNWNKDFFAQVGVRTTTFPINRNFVFSSTSHLSLIVDTSDAYGGREEYVIFYNFT